MHAVLIFAAKNLSFLLLALAVSYITDVLKNKATIGSFMKTWSSKTNLRCMINI